MAFVASFTGNQNIEVAPCYADASNENSTEASKIRERDLNLLLLEEMYSSAEFRQWIREKLGLPSDASFDCGRHLVTDAFGESDLELDFASEVGTYRVLVEDKIDARFQPDQILRYSKRADYYVREQRGCMKCQTMLFAPRRYAPSKVKGFNAVLQYEELRDWYNQSVDEDSRIVWKIALLDAAIKKSQKLRSQKPPDERANKFWYGEWSKNWNALKRGDFQFSQSPATVSLSQVSPG